MRILLDTNVILWAAGRSRCPEAEAIYRFRHSGFLRSAKALGPSM